ncbi:MAG TPA: hypothetical protein DIC42_06395 [Holosporales bacterium]|nr:hypothetical protein [Holosporales bacterium]
MKFILCMAFYCSIACASSDEDWHDCGKPEIGSANELAGIFRPDPEEKSLTDEQSQSVPYNIVNIPVRQNIEGPDSNDKYHRKNLGFFSKYPFLTSYKFVIPCLTVISYFIYRRIR